MIPIVIVDTNVILRFLLANDPKLSPQAKTIFTSAQQGKSKIYIDEVVVAESVWALTSYYKFSKPILVEQLTQLLSPNWIVSPKKKLIFKALHLFATTNLSYIDCWLASLSQAKAYPLKTFDKALSKFSAKL